MIGLEMNKVIVFDIESDGFLNVLTKIHCICLSYLYEKAPRRGQFNGQKDDFGSIETGLEHLMAADVLIGHNIQAFDIPAIKKVYPWFKLKDTCVIRDTLIMSRLQRVHCMHSHSLEAWGNKLKCYKGDFGKQNGWDTWSIEMQKYCAQDVVVNEQVWYDLQKDIPPESAITLEHEFAEVLDWQMKMGVPFDVEAAEKLETEVVTKYEVLYDDLRKDVPPFETRTPFIPKVNNKSRGYVAGVPCTKVKFTEFNPGSRSQVVKLLREKYGWKPTEFTDKGNAKVSGDVLRDLPYPEAKPLAKFYDVKKLMGQLSTGNAAWLRVQRGGKIYGYINHNGAVTGRCTHSAPNLGQVPSARSYKGKECRSLFKAPRGYKVVGCDAKGLELRNLAHYMAAYDGGAYTTVILEGDIHTENQEAAGLPTRDHAKTFIYAHNYGAGDAKLGAILKPEGSEAEQKAAGRRVRTQFMAKLPALRILIDQARGTSKRRGYLIGLDGRRLYVHSQHVALNCLLQGAGGVVMKKWWVEVWRQARAEKLDAYPALHVHDEGQAICADDDTERLAIIMEEQMIAVGKFYNYKCPLEGDSAIGESWADTH